MRVQCLGWEDPLEESMAFHSSILAWRTPWTGEPGGLQSMGVAKGQTQLEQPSTHTHAYGGQCWQLQSQLTTLQTLVKN